MSPETTQLLTVVEAAGVEKKLTKGAVTNIRAWLTESRYRDYAPEVAALVRAADWKTLDDLFWTIIPFGTGGRRGRMYPVGSNAINDRTIGESAQGLADYVKSQHPSGARLSCAIAYDTRHRSRHFAELCASVMVGAGLDVHFLDGHRSTPELSFAVRYCRAACGIMVTASHNPPSDNAVKAYWSTGGQILPPHDRGVIERVMNCGEIVTQPFATALAGGKVRYVQAEVDAAYVREVAALSTPGPRALKVLYSPLHGVGATSVLPVLAAAGFADVELFGPHAAPDGDFPNVPEHVANPENPAVFDALIKRAQETGADVALATDPDADRLGVAAPVTRGGPWKTFTGNQIGALIADYILERRKAAGLVSKEHYVVKTVVTTELVQRIAESYGVTTVGDLMVGFKWIAGAMDERGPERFLFGAEESHGYLAGSYARDKDAAAAALFIAELAAREKAAGRSLHEKLDALSWQHGCHAERTVSKSMPGSQGMALMQQLMVRLRTAPPTSLGGMRVRQLRDYQQRCILRSGEKLPLTGPEGDVVVIDLDEGNYAAVRPSGTEPKVKFYLFAFCPAEQLANLDDTKVELEARLGKVAQDLAKYADGGGVGGSG